MGGQIASVQFKRVANTNLLKACFDGLRHYKEEEKHYLMTQALSGDCQPAIDNLNANIQSIETATDKTDKTRGLNCFKRMILASVSSYFVHWKSRTVKVKIGTKYNLHDAILRCYLAKLESAFATWKKGKKIKEITMQ